MKEMMNDICFFSLREVLKDCLCEVQASALKSSLQGISSGFKPLDDLTGGFENGKVYVIGGRPCMGKEEFMLSMIKDIILESKLPVLLFSTNHIAYSGDSRSPIPMISVHSVGDLLYRRQS